MTAPRVPPTGAPAAATAGAAGLTSVSSAIIRLPQELAARLLQTPRTVLLTGTVTGRSPEGALQVRSQFGEIALRAGTAVPADRQVSIQIPPQSGKAADLVPAQLARNPIPVTLLLARPATGTPAAAAQPNAQSPATNVAGRRSVPAAPQPGPVGQTSPTPPQPAPSTLAAASGAPPAAPPGPAPATPVGVPATQGAAMPDRPATAATATPAASPPPAAGKTATPLPASSPEPPTAAAPTRAQPAVAAPQLGRPALSAQVVTQAGTGPARTGAPTPPPAVGSSATAPPTAPAPAPGPGSTTQASAPPATLPSQVASASPGRMASVAKPAPAPLPIAAGDPGEAPLPIDSARRVPALREAISVLSAADPALATQFVRSVLPQANTQLAATLLFFLSATRGGDIRGWVGDRVAARLDDAGRADLVPRLSAELAAPRAMPEPTAGEWRSQTIPLYQDTDIGGLVLHVRAAGDEGGANGTAEENGRRFLIEMDLSRMGPLQLDGLVRAKRLDLTVRSQAAFPEAMRQDMRALFRDASETVGLQGGLTFQAGGHDWVTVAAARGVA